MHEVSNGAVEGEVVCGGNDRMVERPSTFCVIARLEKGLDMCSDRVMGVNDCLLNGGRHGRCIWVILSKVMLRELSIEMAVYAIGSEFIMCEVDEVKSFAWW